MTAIDRCALSYRFLLEYTSVEHHRWHDWFEGNQNAWDVQFATRPMATVGGLVNHIFAVELRYSQRLRDEPVSDWQDLVVHTSLEDVFALGGNARALLVDFLTSASEAELDRVLTFQTLTAGTVTATKQKMASNIFLHGIRHWGQIATVLRQNDFVVQWPHDALLSSVQL